MAKRDHGKRALCHVRVSTVEQSKFGFSLDAQEERLRAYCRMAGLEVAELIREEGVSASIPLGRRPAGSKLLGQMIGSHIVCLKLDRLFRDAEDALRQTKAWDKAGITLHLVDLGGTSPSALARVGNGSRITAAAAPPLGISSQVRPSSRRPLLLLTTPPHCLKKNGTFARRQRSRICRTQSGNGARTRSGLTAKRSPSRSRVG